MKTNKTIAYGFLTVIIALGILFTVSCKTETDPPETITVEKDVTVTFPGVISTKGTLDFSPLYEPKDGWGDYFSVSDITYTLKDDAGRTFPDGIVSASLYSNNDMPVFTQEFWANGIKVGEHSLSTAVLSGNFLFGIQPLPLKLTLTKTVTK